MSQGATTPDHVRETVLAAFAQRYGMNGRARWLTSERSVSRAVRRTANRPQLADNGCVWGLFWGRTKTSTSSSLTHRVALPTAARQADPSHLLARGVR